MTSPTLYQSTDASAPTISGTVGSLITVLDAVLVDGYGSKAAAGWTKVFSGTNRAVYESARGRLLHVQDDGTRIDARFARMRAAVGATSADEVDLVDPVPADGSSTFAKCFAANSTPAPWKMLATANAFFWFCANSATINGFQPYHTFFAGYGQSPWPGDEGLFVIAGLTTTSAFGAVSGFSSAASTFTNASAAVVKVARNIADTDSDITCTNMCLSPIGNTTTTSDFNRGNNASVDFPNFGTLPLSRAFVAQQTTDTSLRGRVPSLLYPMINVSGADLSTLPEDPWTPFVLDYGLGPRNVVMNLTKPTLTNTNNTVTQNGALFFDLDDDWDVF